ncbi:hypothetical protein DFP72DRAFT_1166919 [Ephemerocybe angulata]|uniref:Uncharacterized protein n=1 Tax=Ephemerocybe angulata TaxID=980116 RepID=A0A8H6MCZ2_9AGAR|nr:hypothetical protein DFP72DRAFT_1166919 [Tulosesus angulatus]
MKFITILATVGLFVLQAAAAPAEAAAAADIPCNRTPGAPVCPTGLTCCFSSDPSFPNGVCLDLSPDKVCAL